MLQEIQKAQQRLQDINDAINRDQLLIEGKGKVLADLAYQENELKGKVSSLQNDAENAKKALDAVQVEVSKKRDELLSGLEASKKELEGVRLTILEEKKILEFAKEKNAENKKAMQEEFDKQENQLKTKISEYEAHVENIERSVRS